MKQLILTSLIIALLFSCKKEEDIPVTHSHGSVVLNTQFLVNDSTYHSDSIYVDDFAHNYKISFSNVYLSQLNFEESGVITPLPIQYILLKPEISNYDLGSVAHGHYHNLKFGLGIDSVTNHSDPNSYPLTSALYPQSPSMHWSWNSGYIFYKIEGSVDTDGDGSFETNFRFHIGTDGLRKDISVTIHDGIDAGKTNNISLKIDLGKFLKGIDLSVDNSTHTSNNMPLAVIVSNNSITAFSK